MAKISFSGTDELMATLQKANMFDDEMQQELLYAAGDIIVEELQKMVKASGFQTEAYASSVKYRKTIKQDKTEIRISPSRQSAKTSTERAGRPCFLF